MFRLHQLIRVLVLLNLCSLYGAQPRTELALPAQDQLLPSDVMSCELCGETYMGYSTSQVGLRFHYLDCWIEKVSPSVAAMLARSTSPASALPESGIAVSSAPIFCELPSMATAVAYGSAPSAGTPGLSVSARAASVAAGAAIGAQALPLSPRKRHKGGE
jgi:hypothetical protein